MLLLQIGDDHDLPPESHLPRRHRDHLPAAGDPGPLPRLQLAALHRAVPPPDQPAEEHHDVVRDIPHHEHSARAPAGRLPAHPLQADMQAMFDDG